MAFDEEFSEAEIQDTDDEMGHVEEAVMASLNEDEDAEGIDYPEDVYVVPLNKRPFFPGMAAPIVIEVGPFYDVLKKVAKSKEKYIALVLTKNEDANVYEVGIAGTYKVGVLARVLRIIPMEDEGAQVILNMEKRVKLKKSKKKGKYFRAEISVVEDKKDLVEALKPYSISIISTIKELLKLNPLFKEELQIFLGHSDFTEPGKLADFAVALTTATREEMQDVLETFDVEKRIEKALILLKKELDLSRLQSTINQKIEASINKGQREFFLREQLRTIKKELGIERDEKSCDIDKFIGRMEERHPPKDVQEVILEELDKLQTLEAQSAEYSVCRNYLDWLTIVPWGMTTEDNHDIIEAEKILEKDHYGLDDIKKRILEFISVGKLIGGVRGSIICLVGPPGVGKTSIGKSVARALNREFYRFSVGGMRDEAEIKGHRRTYIGAMPGKLIQALKATGSMNPVIMLDEVDKIGTTFQGDPASALLEALDSEQNKDFLDHYLDVRCDLSDVLFIVTANILDAIPEPLQDRMDILRLSGYIMDEKIQIAKKYLIPRNRKEMGLVGRQVTFTRETLSKIINGYAREAGVRSLDNYLKKIMRKIAYKIVLSEQKGGKKNKEAPRFRIDKGVLEDYINKPIFTSDRFYKRTPVGVCLGLAWTAMGGATLYIETIQTLCEKTRMSLTGQAGDVMKESAQIAWSYLHRFVDLFAEGQDFFNKVHVHIHIPEGATPKDGPSAGITMVTALLSLLLDVPIKDKLGMTGELTLTGRVLPIGGLKEKLIAARRSGVKTLIFPKDNLRDYEELPDYLKIGLTVHFVGDYVEVFGVAFPKEREKKIKREKLKALKAVETG